MIVTLLSDSAVRLNRAYEIAKSESKYRGEKVNLKNLIKKISSKNSILTLKRLADASRFLQQLESDGFNLASEISRSVNSQIETIENISEIEGLLSNSGDIIDKIDADSVKIDQAHSVVYQNNFNRYKTLLDIFSRERGLSVENIEELIQLNQLLSPKLRT